jgi:hypothetical protein
MARSIVPLNDLQRRAPEAGRIRMGEKTAKAMKSLDTFRFTSPQQDLVQAIARLYGGTVAQWNEPKAKVKRQWQVTIDASEIDVYLPADSLSIWYELWAGGGCQRRCDGVECTVPAQVGPQDWEMQQVPCICDRKQLMECKPYTRLNVIIPNVPFAGVWRLETKGWNAAHELPGMADLISNLQGTGRMVAATLGVERRDEMVMGRKQSFVVPKLAIKQTALELQQGHADASTLALSGAPLPALAAAPTDAAVPPSDRFDQDLDDGIVEAEVLDDELVELEARLRADGRQFGLDPEQYLAAVRRQTNSDRARMAECSALVRADQLIPLSFLADGSVQWARPRQ